MGSPRPGRERRPGRHARAASDPSADAVRDRAGLYHLSGILEQVPMSPPRAGSGRHGRFPGCERSGSPPSRNSRRRVARPRRCGCRSGPDRQGRWPGLGGEGALDGDGSGDGMRRRAKRRRSDYRLRHGDGYVRRNARGRRSRTAHHAGLSATRIASGASSHSAVLPSTSVRRNVTVPLGSSTMLALSGVGVTWAAYLRHAATSNGGRPNALCPRHSGRRGASWWRGGHRAGRLSLRSQRHPGRGLLGATPLLGFVSPTGGNRAGRTTPSSARSIMLEKRYQRVVKQ